MADIHGSRKLAEKWDHMQGETEHPIVILSGNHQGDRAMEAKKRATRVALLRGKCMELKNGSDQLMERSSLLLGLQEGTRTTVALIMLPINMQSHQYQTLQRFVEMAKERAETNEWGRLQIVCARKVELDAARQRATEEEERAEEEGIRQILMLLPKRSCVIPASESKLVKILTCCSIGYNGGDKLSFFMANVGVDIQGRNFLEKSSFHTEDGISGKVLGNVVTKPLLSKTNKASQMVTAKSKQHNSIQNFIISISGQSQSRSECVAGEFMEALESSGINYLLVDNNNTTCKVKMMINDLHGKAIGFIICDFKVFECIKLQQIYKDMQQKDSNFIWIWIPTLWPKNCGHAIYTRVIKCMPWATFPYPHLVNVSIDRPYFVLLEKNGHIANRDAWTLLMGWGLKSYPFTHHTIPESFSLVNYQSCLEFLLHGMNIEGREPKRSKMTFLYDAHPLQWLWLNSEHIKLFQSPDSFEVLYVGNFYETDISSNIENLKQAYEDAKQKMCWPSLSFSDMIMFRYRCKYFSKLKKSPNRMMNAVHVLASKLYLEVKAWPVVLVDDKGVVKEYGKPRQDLVHIIRSTKLTFA